MKWNFHCTCYLTLLLFREITQDQMTGSYLMEHKYITPFIKSDRASNWLPIVYVTGRKFPFTKGEIALHSINIIVISITSLVAIQKHTEKIHLFGYNVTSSFQLLNLLQIILLYFVWFCEGQEILKIFIVVHRCAIFYVQIGF